MDIIRVENLKLHYSLEAGIKKAIDDITLEIKKGIYSYYRSIRKREVIFYTNDWRIEKVLVEVLMLMEQTFQFSMKRIWQLLEEDI